MNTSYIEINSRSCADTETAGKNFACRLVSEHKLADECVFIALFGTLGAGKTAFVRGMASVLTPHSSVTSPTYALVNEYRADSLLFAHFDMYRIVSEDDLYSCGFDDYFRKGVVIACEWCENIRQALPERFYSVSIAITSENGRRISVRLENNKDGNK